MSPEETPLAASESTPGAVNGSAETSATAPRRRSRVQQVGAGVTAGVGAGVGAGVNAVTAGVNAVAGGVNAVAGGVNAVTGVGSGVRSAPGKVGEYLKEQRLASKLSLRQLAELAGVSNPYLSQIERGLRKPSAEVLQQLAKALRISAEQLYVQAGLIAADHAGGASVEAAILADTRLTAAQRNSLLEIHASFVALNAGAVDAPRETTPEV